MNANHPGLDSRQEVAVLAFTRSVAAHELGSRTPLSPPPEIPSGGEWGGLFVTFRYGEQLRGCVGVFDRITDLARAIPGVVRSSLQDRRFANDPITLDELPRLTIEVSLLSAPKPVAGVHEIRAGTHGVIVRRGHRSGCFLPIVAAERSWSAEELVTNCCVHKAGLAADAWRDPKTELLVFTAECLVEHAAATPDHDAGVGPCTE